MSWTHNLRAISEYGGSVEAEVLFIALNVLGSLYKAVTDVVSLFAPTRLLFTIRCLIVYKMLCC